MKCLLELLVVFDDLDVSRVLVVSGSEWEVCCEVVVEEYLGQ